MQKLNIADASLALGISQDLIRRRLRSGKIPGERIPCAGGFRWLVEIDAPIGEGANGQTAPPTEEKADGLVELLKGQVQDLRDQLADRAREISELHQIIGARALNSARKPWWQFWT